MYTLYPFARPFLFALDAETAHEIAFAGLDRAAKLGVASLVAPRVPDDPVEVMGIAFPNRVGLAAGLDKNGAHVDGLATFGFGFLEIGTVTPRAQPGNPRPRMFRLPRARALVNRLGFNNDGVEALLRNVERSRYRGVLGINIGKNFDTPNERAADDYVACLRAVYARADYVTVNISSPNTKGLRDLQAEDALAALLTRLKREQAALAQEHGKHVPLAIKIAPDLADDAVRGVARVLVSQKMDAVIATNTTLAREAVAGMPHAEEAGGLSGAPLFERSTEVVRVLAKALDGALPIIGVGGIDSGERAARKIAAGASLVQVYTGLIYRGPALVAECVRHARREGAQRCHPFTGFVEAETESKHAVAQVIDPGVDERGVAAHAELDAPSAVGKKGRQAEELERRKLRDVVVHEGQELALARAEYRDRALDRLHAHEIRIPRREHPVEHRPRHLRKAGKEVVPADRERGDAVERIGNDAAALRELGHQHAIGISLCAEFRFELSDRFGMTLERNARARRRPPAACDRRASRRCRRTRARGRRARTIREAPT